VFEASCTRNQQFDSSARSTQRPPSPDTIPIQAPAPRRRAALSATYAPSPSRRPQAMHWLTHASRYRLERDNLHILRARPMEDSPPTRLPRDAQSATASILQVLQKPLEIYHPAGSPEQGITAVGSSSAPCLASISANSPPPVARIHPRRGGVPLIAVASGSTAWCLGGGADPLPGKQDWCARPGAGSIGPILNRPAHPGLSNRQAGAHPQQTWGPRRLDQLGGRWRVAHAPRSGQPAGLRRLVSLDQEQVRAGWQPARMAPAASASAVEGCEALVLLNRTVERRSEGPAPISRSCRCKLAGRSSDLDHA